MPLGLRCLSEKGEGTHSDTHDVRRQSRSAITNIDRSPPTNENVCCSLTDDSSKIKSTAKRQALSVSPDALTELLVSADQGPRKLHPALQRLKDRNLASMLSAMKVRLSVDDTYCGALTSKGTSCRRPTPARNKDTIVSSLQVLHPMDQCSKELDSALEDLVCLVHCHLHDCGPPSESRVGIWIEAFPEGANADTSPVVVARKIRKTLGRTSTICVGLTKAGLRCRSRIGGQKVQNCGSSIAELLKPDDHWDRAICELFLSVLEANRYCRTHMSQQSTQNVQRWLESISLLHEVAPSGNTASLGDNSSIFVHPGHAALTLARTRSGLQAKVDLMLQIRKLSSTTYRTNMLPWTSDTLVEFWPLEPDTTHLDIISRAGSERNKEYFNPTIHDVMVAPPDSDDQKTGYIYAYEVEGSPGLVKIGYTSRSIDVRHKEWAEDCNRQPTLLYPVKLDKLERVPNARRIESLCHAELDKYRLRIYCQGCLKQHIEWFAVAAEKSQTS